MTTARLANYLYQITDREQQNLLKTFDYTQINSLPEIWPMLAIQCGSVVCLDAPHSQPPISLTYQQVATQIRLFATGLQSLGILPAQALAKPLLRNLIEIGSQQGSVSWVEE